MSNNIHKTAIISADVRFGDNVTVGPYSIIEGPVAIGDGTVIGAHCRIEGNTTLGKNCQFFTGAIIGTPPQDKKHKITDKVFLTIGDNNIFREYVTINPGTIDGGANTVIGSNNLFMANAHVAHDCHVGSDCTVANCSALAGHVSLEDRVIIGGMCGVHQFVRIGCLSIVGGCSKVVQDVPPYSIADGNPAVLRGINVVGLKRANYNSETSMALRRAYKVLFNSGLARGNALAQVKEQKIGLPEVAHLIEFVELSKRGIC